MERVVFADRSGFTVVLLATEDQDDPVRAAGQILQGVQPDDTLRLARLIVRADTPDTAFQSWLAGRGAPTEPLPDRWSGLGWRTDRRLRARRRLPPPH